MSGHRVDVTNNEKSLALYGINIRRLSVVSTLRLKPPKRRHLRKSGHTDLRGRLRAVDHLIKVACFAQKVNDVSNLEST
jgi:hypothetical protein